MNIEQAVNLALYMAYHNETLRSGYRLSIAFDHLGCPINFIRLMEILSGNGYVVFNTNETGSKHVFEISDKGRDLVEHLDQLPTIKFADLSLAQKKKVDAIIRK